MKKYISPDIKVIELEIENTILDTSRVGISNDYSQDFAAPSRGSSWSDYEN